MDEKDLLIAELKKKNAELEQQLAELRAEREKIRAETAAARMAVQQSQEAARDAQAPRWLPFSITVPYAKQRCRVQALDASRLFLA
jgi:septal ring factor EnvC (AmiA/AmiB activator)